MENFINFTALLNIHDAQNFNSKPNQFEQVFFFRFIQIFENFEFFFVVVIFGILLKMPAQLCFIV